MQMLPLNELNALRSQSQVAMPTFGQVPQTGVAPTNTSGNVWNAYNAQVANANNMMNGLFSLGAAGITAASDIRLKHKIKLVARTVHDLAVYEFEYLWSSVKQIGVMAQDVLRVKPEAVAVHPSGYLMVDYGKARLMAQVTGLDPSVLVSPDYQVQMQRAQRQAALASALRSQSLADTPGNGGSVSWTQGVARLADALAANISNKRSEKTQTKANQAYAAGMARMFGLNTPQQPNPAAPMSAAPQMPQGAPPQAPAGPPADPLAPLPDAPPQAAAPQPAQSQQPANGPMNLTGDSRRDLGLYVSNPEEYGKALIGNAAKGTAPTDIEVTVAHARQALESGDTATAAALLGNLQKQNFIAPTAARPGGWTQDPHTGQWMFHPQAPIPGAVPGRRTTRAT
jgi:hypothetical protein